MYSSIFPNLQNYRICSDPTINYNCIAWAAGDTEKWWWPDIQNLKYWPPNIPRNETIDAFIKAFEKLGYSVCDNSDFQNGFEKIAIYANSQRKAKHAAKQITNGLWISKLGKEHDIEHRLNELEGDKYGEVSVIMSRHV